MKRRKKFILKILTKLLLKLEDNKPQVHDLMEEIILGTVEDPRITYISYLLSNNLKEQIISLLQEFKDYFSWNYDEMLGFDRGHMEHRLTIRPESILLNNHLEECPRK